MVIEDASPGNNLNAIKYVVQGSRIFPGDKLMLLGVLREVTHPMGYRIKVDSSWPGASQKIVREEVARKREEYINNGEVIKVSQQCKSMKIELDIDVRGGASPKDEVREAATTFRATWIILDRKMKKDTDHLMARLSCGISIMKRNHTIEDLRQPRARNQHMQHMRNSSNLTVSDEPDPTRRDYICSICSNRRPKMGWRRDFSFAELQAATKGFSWKMGLDFGVANRGELNGLKITVKQHKNACYQGAEKEFQSEVHMLSEVRHENLAMLLGSCSEGNHRLLVYEYVCNGSLDNHLSGNQGGLLRWDLRMKIALGAARGLKYLHENDIIHRNLRPDNILLTHDYKPLLGDFGIEMTLYEDSDFSSETRIGTMPYLAPEYADSGEVSPKSDCYSFGVILLHLITGLRSTDPLFGEQSIVEWAKPLLKEKTYRELIEHSLTDSCNVNQLTWVIRVADKCLIKNPYKRMSMDQFPRRGTNNMRPRFHLINKKNGEIHALVARYTWNNRDSRASCWRAFIFRRLLFIRNVFYDWEATSLSLHFKFIVARGTNQLKLITGGLCIESHSRRQYSCYQELLTDTIRFSKWHSGLLLLLLGVPLR